MRSLVLVIHDLVSAHVVTFNIPFFFEFALFIELAPDDYIPPLLSLSAPFHPILPLTFLPRKGGDFPVKDSPWTPPVRLLPPNFGV